MLNWWSLGLTHAVTPYGWVRRFASTIYGLYSTHGQVSSVQPNEGNNYFLDEEGSSVPSSMTRVPPCRHRFTSPPTLLYANKTHKTEHSGFDLRKFKECHGKNSHIGLERWILVLVYVWKKRNEQINLVFREKSSFSLIFWGLNRVFVTESVDIGKFFFWKRWKIHSNSKPV